MYCVFLYLAMYSIICDMYNTHIYEWCPLSGFVADSTFMLPKNSRVMMRQDPSNGASHHLSHLNPLCVNGRILPEDLR